MFTVSQTFSMKILKQKKTLDHNVQFTQKICTFFSFIDLFIYALFRLQIFIIYILVSQFFSRRKMLAKSISEYDFVSSVITLSLRRYCPHYVVAGTMTIFFQDTRTKNGIYKQKIYKFYQNKQRTQFYCYREMNEVERKLFCV